MFGFFRSEPVTTHAAKDVAARLAEGTIHLVDVREDGEWRSGRIAGARHAPLSALSRLAPGLPTDKPVVFYCHSGARSAQAVALCRKLGLAHDAHLGGGVIGWRAAGLPLVR